MISSIFQGPSDWWRGIAPGDSVTYSTHQKQNFSGKVMLSFATHVVVLVRGRGLPAVVDDANFVSHRKARKTKSKPSNAD